MTTQTIRYPEELFKLYRRGWAFPVWFWEHKGLFHERLLNSKQRSKYGFGESFTAIHFRKLGYKVLTGGHRKQTIDKRRYKIALDLLGKKGAKVALKQTGTHPPDLLVYKKGGPRFFVEVKMPWDSVSDAQKKLFAAIEKRLRWRVKIVRLKPRRPRRKRTNR